MLYVFVCILFAHTACKTRQYCQKNVTSWIRHCLIVSGYYLIQLLDTHSIAFLMRSSLYTCVGSGIENCASYFGFCKQWSWIVWITCQVFHCFGKWKGDVSSGSTSLCQSTPSFAHNRPIVSSDRCDCRSRKKKNDWEWMVVSCHGYTTWNTCVCLKSTMPS